ncbi:ankyrin repeat domain-containing protein [Candidatus Cardinium hertigii]|uniref:ankyrin repeat domain-containing protein n=1 Tax=Candidatus Cardinium hertigii TaxID=247481 RepID=UPI003D7D8889
MIRYIQSITPINSSYTMAIVTGTVLFFTAACSNLTGRYGHLPDRSGIDRIPAGIGNHPANAIGLDLNNARNEAGNTPLHLAVIDNNLENLETLLREPATNVNARNASGNTPLHLAVAYRRLSIVQRLLIIPGIDLNVINNIGSTPLDVVLNRVLFTFNYHNAGNEVGNTPLHLAVIDNNLVSVESLLSEPGTNVNARNASGNTPLHLAVVYRRPSIVQRLVTMPGIHVNITNNDGRTPLDLALISS